MLWCSLITCRQWQHLKGENNYNVLSCHKPYTLISKHLSINNTMICLNQRIFLCPSVCLSISPSIHPSVRTPYLWIIFVLEWGQYMYLWGNHKVQVYHLQIDCYPKEILCQSIHPFSLSYCLSIHPHIHPFFFTRLWFITCMDITGKNVLTVSLHGVTVFYSVLFCRVPIVAIVTFPITTYEATKSNSHWAGTFVLVFNGFMQNDSFSFSWANSAYIRHINFISLGDGNGILYHISQRCASVAEIIQYQNFVPLA